MTATVVWDVTVTYFFGSLILDHVYPPLGERCPHLGLVDNALPVDFCVRPQVMLAVDQPRQDPDSDGDDSGTEVQVVTPLSRPEGIGRIDETRRVSFKSFHFGRERPTWLAAWLSLISSIVSGQTLKAAFSASVKSTARATSSKVYFSMAADRASDASESARDGGCLRCSPE